jgi:hydrogenase large subunit
MTDIKEAPSIPETQDSDVIEMAWDPITRIVGSLGIYASIDFKQKTVKECHSTSSIFRGYSIFMKGKDPRDAHFITSRICGICGDNHATCSVYTQNMAYGVAPPHLGEWIINCGEAAEYMFARRLLNIGCQYFRQRMDLNSNETGKPGTIEFKHQSKLCALLPMFGANTRRLVSTLIEACASMSMIGEEAQAPCISCSRNDAVRYL